jgi:hypothetical protein
MKPVTIIAFSLARLLYNKIIVGSLSKDTVSLGSSSSSVNSATSTPSSFLTIGETTEVSLSPILEQNIFTPTSISVGQIGKTPSNVPVFDLEEPKSISAMLSDLDSIQKEIDGIASLERLTLPASVTSATTEPGKMWKGAEVLAPHFSQFGRLSQAAAEYTRIQGRDTAVITHYKVALRNYKGHKIRLVPVSNNQKSVLLGDITSYDHNEYYYWDRLVEAKSGNEKDLSLEVIEKWLRKPADAPTVTEFLVVLNDLSSISMCRSLNTIAAKLQAALEKTAQINDTAVPKAIGLTLSDVVSTEVFVRYGGLVYLMQTAIRLGGRDALTEYLLRNPRLKNAPADYLSTIDRFLELPVPKEILDVVGHQVPEFKDPENEGFTVPAFDADLVGNAVTDALKSLEGIMFQAVIMMNSLPFETHYRAGASLIESGTLSGVNHSFARTNYPMYIVEGSRFVHNSPSSANDLFFSFLFKNGLNQTNSFFDMLVWNGYQNGLDDEMQLRLPYSHSELNYTDYTASLSALYAIMVKEGVTMAKLGASPIPLIPVRVSHGYSESTIFKSMRMERNVRPANSLLDLPLPHTYINVEAPTKVKVIPSIAGGRSNIAIENLPYVGGLLQGTPSSTIITESDAVDHKNNVLTNFWRLVGLAYNGSLNNIKEKATTGSGDKRLPEIVYDMIKYVPDDKTYVIDQSMYVDYGDDFGTEQLYYIMLEPVPISSVFTFTMRAEKGDPSTYNPQKERLPYFTKMTDRYPVPVQTTPVVPAGLANVLNI